MVPEDAASSAAEGLRPSGLDDEAATRGEAARGE